MIVVRLTTLLLILAAILVGCQQAAPDAGDGDASPPGETAAGTPAGDGGDGGGDMSGEDFCLNTPEEVEAALEVDVSEATGNVNADTGGGCLYYAENQILVYAIAVVSGQGAADDTINAGRETEGVVEIEGIGDEALLMSRLGPLVVRIGDTIISQGPTADVPDSDDQAAMRAAMEELARAAADRLP